MKILFDFKDMIGGAPRSHLAHMMLLKNNGYDVMATIGDDLEELQKLAVGIRIIPVTNFMRVKGFKLFNTIRRWVKLINSEKPDIIYSNRIPQFKFLAVVSDLTGVPLVFAQAGGEANKRNFITMKGKTPIAYSMENKKVFVDAGFSENKIHVISNRISQSISNKGEAGFIHGPNCLNVLMVGNIKSATINGYINFFEFLKNNSNIINTPFCLKIAGKDISPESAYESVISGTIAAINKSLQNTGKIEAPAWIENIQAIQVKSDVVIGKGRSVIEPAMAGKVCFVLAETGRLTRISPDTFHSLYEHNFSGRGQQQDNTNDFLQILQEGINNQIAKQAKQVALYIENAYLLDYAKEKLVAAFAEAMSQNKKNKIQRFFIGLRRFVCKPSASHILF